MLVTHGRSAYRIVFRHRPDCLGAVPGSEMNKRVRMYSGKTICVIEDGTLGVDTVHGTGIAFCSEKDNYEKERGRKIALTRALRDMGANKGLRTKVWESYLERK